MKNFNDDYRKKLEMLGLVKTNAEIIGEIIGFLLVIVILAGALATCFSLTWGQSFVISYMFNTLVSVIQKK